MLKIESLIKLPIILLWGAFLFASPPNLKEVAQAPKWLALLHYKKNFWGDYSSRIKTSSFFLSRNGLNDPLSELESSLREKGWACRFPARYEFLREKGLVHKVIDWERDCPELTFFRDQLRAKSVSMIFSSYYVNTPASAFGHTFLRFNKSSGEKNGYELLDRAVNYAANVTTSNAFLYGLLGMAGGFFGEFAMLPYFYKLREYNDFEARDIWSYELNLTEEEIGKLIDHIWEMKQGLGYYYYLSENCSFYMMAILETVNPQWKLLEKTKKYVIPGDTIRTLQSIPDMIRNVSYRPSLRKKLYHRYQKLSPIEQKAFKERELLESLPEDGQAKVLDTLLEYQDFQYSYKVMTNQEEGVEKKRELLLKRSKLSTPYQKHPLTPPMEEAPHLAHGGSRLRLGYGYQERWGSTYSAELRYALHDKTDPYWGYSPHMEIDFGKIRGSFARLFYKGKSRHRIFLEELTLVRVSSHNPWTKFFRDFSWEFKAGVESLEAWEAPFHMAPSLKLSFGYYFEMNKVSTGFFWRTEAQLSSIFKKSYSFQTGPEWQIYYLGTWGSFGGKIQGLKLLPKEKTHWLLGTEVFGSFFLAKNLAFNLKWNWTKVLGKKRNRYETGFSFYY